MLKFAHNNSIEFAEELEANVEIVALSSLLRDLNNIFQIIKNQKLRK